jgi:hypothetical protein
LSRPWRAHAHPCALRTGRIGIFPQAPKNPRQHNAASGFYHCRSTGNLQQNDWRRPEFLHSEPPHFSLSCRQKPDNSLYFIALAAHLQLTHVSPPVHCVLCTLARESIAFGGRRPSEDGAARGPEGVLKPDSGIGVLLAPTPRKRREVLIQGLPKRYPPISHYG